MWLFFVTLSCDQPKPDIDFADHAVFTLNGQLDNWTFGQGNYPQIFIFQDQETGTYIAMTQFDEVMDTPNSEPELFSTMIAQLEGEGMSFSIAEQGPKTIGPYSGYFGRLDMAKNEEQVGGEFFLFCFKVKETLLYFQGMSAGELGEAEESFVSFIEGIQAK